MRFLLLLLIAILAALPSATAQGKRAALVIANSKYQHISELANPANDAKLAQATLLNAGFATADITVAYDLDYDAMRRAILAFKRKADGADVALIYFAGHGFGGGENFLIPIDAQLRSFHELRDEAFSQRALEDAVSLASGLKLVILDACRNDPSRGRMTGLPATRAVGSGLRQVEPESGVLVAYSAKHGTVAQDGPPGGNSPFALALTQHLTAPGRDIRFIFGSVRDAVIKATKAQQEPFLYGSLGGEYVYLVPPKEGAQPPLSDAAQAWSLVKDSDDLRVLEAFRTQYGAQNPLYDTLAEQRLGVLRTLKYEDKAQRLVRSFAGHSGSVWSVAFSPDGRFALSGSSDTTLKLWDAGTGRDLRSFAGNSSSVRSVAFSPDGRFALSGSDDKTLKLWDVGAGKELRSFAGHSSSVLSVAFSPDGRFALSGGDYTLKLWEVGTGKELRSFAGLSSSVFSVAFSPDGRFALSGSWDKTLKLWDVSEWTAPQAGQPSAAIKSAAPAPQAEAPGGTVFKPIIKKD